MDFVTVKNADIHLNVAVAGEGPLILCVHGWPELWYSWRHQMAHFAALGYQVAAMDVRGYGGSAKPREISAYTLKELCSDAAAVIDQLGNGQAILFGHDWGAPIAWHTALLYPEKVSAVAGLSVPYHPRGDIRALDLWRHLYPDSFFYQLYFQQQDLPEAEFEADIPVALRKAYFAISGGAELNQWLKPKPADAKLLDGLIDPEPFPNWMTADDLQVYVTAFSNGGFRGPINRYRAQDLDFDQLSHVKDQPISQPAFFIGGERDAVRYFVPGSDGYADPGSACTDFRGAVILPDIGHWVQQEAPQATNDALTGFIAGL